MPVLEISAQELQSQSKSDDPPVILDVREQEEWNHCRIDGALHIPMSQIRDRFSELDKHTTIVVYCHLGVRSMHVANFLHENGYSNIASLAGGIESWSLEIDPNVPRY